MVATDDAVALQRELGRLRSELDSIHHALASLLLVLDESCRVSRWNERSQEIFGLPSHEPLGKDIFTLGLFHDPETVRSALSRSARYSSAVRIDETPFRRPDGSTGILGLTINPIGAHSGELSGYLVLGKDLTEIKAAEYRAPHAKLESIGRLAAGVAHELNTPIQYVGDNLHFLSDAFEKLQPLLHIVRELRRDDPGELTREQLIAKLQSAIGDDDLAFLADEIPRAVSESLEGTGHVANIVRAMKEFSHPNVKQKAPTNINKALETTITVARNEWKYVADLTTDFDPELPDVPCLPGELNQVFLNLIVNAAHAIEDVIGRDRTRKGHIAISTRLDGRFVEIRVRDDGSGIPDAFRPKVFDMFFTTKRVGLGTGQGLAIAHDVVTNKHGGALSFETEIGTGTTFIVRLPVDAGNGSPG